MNDHLARPRTIVWSIAGSDSGAGAGIQADLRAFDAFEVHGCTAVAAITAQNSVLVARIEPVATAWLDAQLAALASDLPPRAIKTGMLGSVENLRCVVAWVDRLRASERGEGLALVVDPVWRASTGAALGDEALRLAMRTELIPRATVITPNRAEAAWLLGWDARAMDDTGRVEEAAAALRALGAESVVITGGDATAGANDIATGSPKSGRSLDWMSTPETRGWLSLPRVHTPHHHGSGCVFAASTAAVLALGFCTADAIVIAKMSATQAVRGGRAAGQGAGAVRPQRGFGLEPDLLPSLSDTAAHPAPAFAPLADRQLGLYAIVDSAEAIERVLKAGVRTVQLRMKHAADASLRAEPSTRAELSEAIRRSVHAARATGAQLFVNDHWQLAIEHRAYGVHLGQEDVVDADLDAIRRAGLRLGLSTHCVWEVCRAHALAPSYIACGPIHPTTTKAMPWLPQGSGNLAYWCRVLREPVVAIAGMDAARAHEAVRCGAAGVAVLRGLAQTSDPGGVVQHYTQAMQAGAADQPLAAPELPRPTFVAAKSRVTTRR
ncbi:thiamine phosphate synthase [soil metagenome]